MKQLNLPPQIRDAFAKIGASLRGLTGRAAGGGEHHEAPSDAGANQRNVLLLLGGAAIVFSLGLFLVVFMGGAGVTSAVRDASELRVLSQNLAKNALEAAAGNPEAFKSLEAAREEYSTKWKSLQDNGAVEGIDDMAALDTLWKDVEPAVRTILQGEDTVLDLHEVAKTLAETIPQLQAEYETVVEVLIDSEAAPDQVALAQRQSWLAERIVRSIAKVLEGGEDAVVAADAFGRDTNLFARVLNGMLEGDRALEIEQVEDEEALDSLAEISELFDEFVQSSVDEILETSPELKQVRDAAGKIFTDSQALLEHATGVANAAADKGTGGYLVWIAGLLAVVGLGLFGATFWIQRGEDRHRREVVEKENERNQQAILRLLDELGDLADGDLTVTATVSEDFTGAIADSINFAIDQMRSLVSTINQTAVQVSSAAQETQSTAMHLAEAAEHQAQEIAGASAAINEMAVSIDQVSANAAESAAVAERSVTIANKGAEVVQATIRGMDTIREQIQETSKRIKRLGESSQEIGDIVSLITDIADQTNILALNAAIQASMAGDAGRGFAVVADEVQRLAERSSAAAKQIETLVKTIQTDTNEAVISMEQTTSEVVRGARLAQDAGVALEEIENVSKTLAELIQNISNAARQQAASAGHISNTMNVIQEITSQTSAGTTATAKSIGNLAEMAAELRNSVASFKLPEYM
jgi:twitching motility protein PilJ